MADNERRTGRTTRQVDETIQILFREGKVKIPNDHYNESRANRFLLDTIRKRLNSEHGGQGRIEGEYLIL